jgi:hypothetical protein
MLVTPKAYKPKQRDEICSSGMVAKAEKSYKIT